MGGCLLDARHDPIRQENYLRQCLAHDKKPLGLFLGAGAPMAIRIPTAGNFCPLIPDIAEMTKVICSRVKEGNNDNAFNSICSYFAGEGDQEPNIESILSHIRSLRQVAGSTKIRGLSGNELDELDAEICNIIDTIVNKSLNDNSTPYHKVAAWINAIPRVSSVELFTTNYDLLMEQALEELRVPYFDGFIGSNLAFFDAYAIEEDQLPARWARLWKLHGSINWRSNNNGIVYRSMNPIEFGGSRVIHPSHLKYDESRKMPYLAMIDRLRAFIKKSSSLLMTCGYSFRDQHLNSTIIQGLQGNQTAIVFALLYGRLDNYQDAIQLALKNPNLSLLAEDQAIIGTRKASWIERKPDDVIRSLAIDWNTRENDSSEYLQASFKLGDFNRLGVMLEDILGGEIEGELHG